MSNLAVALVACSVFAVAVIIISRIITRNTKLPSPPSPPRPVQLRTNVYRAKDGDLVILTGAGTAISVAGAVVYSGSSGGCGGGDSGGGGGGCEGGDSGGGGGGCGGGDSGFGGGVDGGGDSGGGGCGGGGD